MFKLAGFAIAVMLVLGCDKGGTGGGGAGVASPVAQQDGAAGLEALFEAAAAACGAADHPRGKALTMSVLPTRAHLERILRPDAPAGVVDKLLAQYKALPADDQQLACLLVPGEGRTQITVHAATVEELRAPREGSPAHAEFPGGARKLAEQVLRPGVTFYEVEITEPGKDTGTKFHMFFWDGAQWRMLGAGWRVLPG